MQVDPRRTQRQDTYDLRDQIRADDHRDVQAHAEAAAGHYEDEEHSILEDDSEAEEGEEMIDDDDMSSQLSIPNESIDFDMVYALHSFAATVEGQANVVKGDSLYLMDDSNSYWWLVRVLKTQEVGYIPAENIETPFERLARLNKHRNVDLALATQEELREGVIMERNIGKPKPPSPNNRNGSRSNQRKSVVWNSNKFFCRYIPPLREGELEEEDDEWEEDEYEEPDEDLLAETQFSQSMDDDEIVIGMDSDGMQWDDSIVDEVQLIAPPSQRQHQIQQQQQQQQQQQLQQQQQQQGPRPQVGGIPDALQPGSLRAQQAQQMLRSQQQQQQDALIAQQQQGSANQSQAGPQQQPGPRSQSREENPGQTTRRIDPAEVVETRKVTVTPNIAREDDGRTTSQPYLPSAVLDEDRSKRSREDDSSDESKKKAKGAQKMAAPVSSSSYNKQPPAKLRKEPSKSDTEDDGKEKKKKPSVFSNLFKSKKDKGKDRSVSIGSVDSNEYTGRTSEESSRSGHRPPDPAQSPTTATAQQQQQALTQKPLSSSPVMDQAPSTPERTVAPQVSVTASQLRQRDQQQQALYQQYLNRSPSSPPETQPSYGLQSASAIMRSPSSNSALGPPTPRPRPGSLILTSPSTDIQANLSVIRVFAGKNLQTEATFKTVLLNPSTTSSDLVKQAIQRFRLPSLDDADDYYLIIKQVEGGVFTKLDPLECPLQVFESLVESAEVPRVKRSSVGSISSIASNLSMHPAIKKLSMNDFSDDSAVKIYLNRRGDDNGDDSLNGHEGDDTLDGDVSLSEVPDMLPGGKSPYLSVMISGSVAPDRFSSPSIRFPVQVVIYAEDVPEDMQFHPTTEAIVLKGTVDANTPIAVSPNLRRKIFMFPKNITVAEVTEIGLERFGIQDGVVDGGDEVEDKTTKRRSVVRVRYGLNVAIDGHERELTPSSKIIDAFLRPPSFRPADRQGAAAKRRSLDSSALLGSIEDIKSDDPVFVLRRATSYRNSTSRRRSSAPLDEIALQHLHRESTSSYNSDAPTPVDENRLKRQEIMAQRAAQRANQEKIVSTQTNSVRGMDVLLPGNVMIRSSRYDVGDKMRYSYVEPDGVVYDISDIIEEEWHSLDDHHRDVLEGVMRRDKEGIDKLDRVLSKIRKGKGKEKDFSSLSSTEDRTLSMSNSSVSEYSGDEGDVTNQSQNGPVSVAEQTQTQTRATPLSSSPLEQYSRPGTTTPTGARALPTPGLNQRRTPTVPNEVSGRGTPLSAPQVNLARVAEERSRSGSKATQRPLILPKDDFGLSNMMAIIESNASRPKRAEPVLDPVDELLFGTPLDLESLHPSVREIYAPGFRQLEEVDKLLDTYIARSAVGAF